MDAVSAAIVAALAAGAFAGITDSARATLLDVYRSLKSKLVQKFSSGSDVSHALAQLEERPDSPARQSLLAEEVVRSGASTDPELLVLARQLSMLTGSQHGATSQVATGAYIAQADNRSRASVIINDPQSPRLAPSDQDDEDAPS